MDVLSLDVVMLKDDVGLLAIAKCLHILLGDLCKLFIG